MKARKKQLRKLIVEKRTALSAATLKAWSDEIMERLEQHPAFRAAHTVLLYHSMSDEVDTRAFIEKWSASKQILLPVVKEEELELRLYDPKNGFTAGTYGIMEPIGEPFVQHSEIDLAIIPGVAFDTFGHRLGRGKGYYDRLLPLLQAYKIGICFPFQLLNEVPVEAFDVLMDEAITATN